MLARSEARYRSLVSATTSVVWTTDATGAIVAPQASWEAYTGQPWAEHQGWGWVHTLHPDDRERLRARWSRALAERVLDEVDGRVWHAPSRHYRHFVARGAPVLDRDGSVREWICTLTDVHERRELEQALRRLPSPERRLELLRRAGPVHVSGPFAFQVQGADPGELADALQRLTDRGNVPEALRIAHLIGTALVTGESGRRA